MDPEPRDSEEEIETLVKKQKGKKQSSRAEFQNSMYDIDLFLFFVLFSSTKGFRTVCLSRSRVTRICCLISEKRIVRIQQNLVRSFVIDCFVGAHDRFT